MPLNKSQIYLNLDTNKPNLKIDERFLQGNSDKTLNIKFLKNNEAVTITDGVKATITLVYYNGSSIYKKYLISPTLEGGGNNTNYKIPPISNNMLTVPLDSDIAFIDHAGRVDLIIKIDDSGSYYTYSCTYNVDTNEAYNPVGIIDNLPSIDNLKADVSTLKTDVSQAKTNIAYNTQALTNKANSNLSNVGNFDSAPDGSILYKKDGQLKHTPIIIDDTGKVINSPYSLSVPPNTVNLGDNISLKENGGFINFFTKASGKYYVALDYENNALTGSKKPIYYERGPIQTKVELQNVDTTQMNNITSINLGTATNDVQVQSLYLKLINATTNFRVKLNINGQDVAYYPSKAAWNGTEAGFNLASGLQKITLDPFWSTITGFNRTLYFRSDTPVNLWGNGTLPYVAEDINAITKKDIALMEDISGSIIPETGETIKNKLETLTGANRLSASAIKNLDNTLAKMDLSNVSSVDFEKKFLTTDAYNRIAEFMNMSHPDALSRAVELKPSDSVNLSTTAGSILFLDYQFNSNNQVIRQTLPPSSQGKYLMFATVYPNTFDGTQIILSPAASENINDSSSDVIITRSGFLGIAIPTNNGYIWVQSTNLSGETGKTIKQKLETLTGNNRLDASAIKNLPNASNTLKVGGETGSPEYDASKILFPNATVVNNSGEVTINTAFVVTDEQAEIVSDCDIIEVPTTSLISATQNPGNNKAAVIDFKGIPTDSGDNTQVIYSKYLSFPQALVVKNGDKSIINTAPTVSKDGNIVVGRAETFEFPSAGGLNAEAIAGTDTTRITAKGFDASSEDIPIMSGIKSIDFPNSGLLTAEEDPGDSSKLLMYFGGLPTKKTTGSPVRKAMELAFPQANVFGTDGGTVTVGTGHLVSQGDNELSSTVNTWTIPDDSGLLAELDANNSSNIILRNTVTNTGISVTNDDTQPVNQTTVAYYPQARIEDGSTSGSKIIKTSIPVHNGTDDYDDYKKINFENNDFIVSRDSTDNDQLNIKTNGFSVETDNVETANIKLLDFDKNNFLLDVATEGVAKITTKNKQNNGFLAYYTHREVIGSNTRETPYRNSPLRPNEIIWNDANVVYDQDDGKITLIPSANGTKTQFKVCARVTVREQVKENDIEGYLYLADATTGNYIQDINNETPIVHKTIKKELTSDYLELITMVEIDANTDIKIMFRDNLMGAYIDILDLNMGISAIAIEKVNESNQPSEAIRDYETLTQQSMRFVKHVYDENFENSSMLIANTSSTDQNLPDNTIFMEDGFIINYADRGLLKSNDSPDGSKKVLQMEDFNTGFGFFNIARVLDYEDTFSLRGKQIKLEVVIEEQQGDFILAPIVWKRKINSYPMKVIDSMDNSGNYTVTDGWMVVDADKVAIPAPTPAETTATFTSTYTVPNDAVNVGFILMPSKKQTRSIIKFSDARIGCNPTLTRWVINYPYQAIEGQLQKDNKYIKFVPENSTDYNMSDWYQLDQTYPTALYVGQAVAGGNADVVKTGDNPTGNFNQIHNIGKLKFLKDGVVSIHAEVRLGCDAFDENLQGTTANLHFAKDSGDGNVQNSIAVASSRHDLLIRKDGNVWTDGVRTGNMANWTFTMDVKANEEYFFICQAIGLPANGHLYAYPAGMIEINFLENEYFIKQLQDTIATLQSQIIFTDNAKTTNTKLKVDNTVDGNTPTVTATTTP